MKELEMGRRSWRSDAEGVAWGESSLMGVWMEIIKFAN